MITVFPPSSMSYMFHFPNIEWTRIQAQAMGVPQVTQITAGVKEEELHDLSTAISQAKTRHRIECIYTGALASIYQKKRVEEVCAKLGIRCVSPLWGTDPETHLRRLVSEGFDFIMTSVSAMGLDQNWLGRKIDDKAIDELVVLARKFRFHPGLEGGEGETFVLDCPLFSSRFLITKARKDWKGDAGMFTILDATLVRKEEAA